MIFQAAPYASPNHSVLNRGAQVQGMPLAYWQTLTQTALPSQLYGNLGWRCGGNGPKRLYRCTLNSIERRSLNPKIFASHL